MLVLVRFEFGGRRRHGLLPLVVPAVFLSMLRLELTETGPREGS